MSYQPNPAVESTLAELPVGARVLDVGGWYHPHPRATHVVDLMPYETRGRSEVGGAERFTRETWHQADITEPSLRLPWPDGYFDFALLLHTLEDLHEPRPIVRELSRVAQRGYVECPSRLAEQTIGIDGRATTRIGYNHHKWIVDQEGDALILFDKHESFFQPASQYRVPLVTTERSTVPRVVRHEWADALRIRLEYDSRAARDRAAAFRNELGIRPMETWLDTALRARRRVRDAFRGIDTL